MAGGYKHLCTAIAHSDDRTFQSLIHSSAELVSHWKPLCDAAFLGKPKYVEALLQAGADPNQRAGTASRHTPLTRITQYHKTIPRHSGHLRCVQILLAYDADPRRVGGLFSWAPYPTLAWVQMSTSSNYYVPVSRRTCLLLVLSMT